VLVLVLVLVLVHVLVLVLTGIFIGGSLLPLPLRCCSPSPTHPHPYTHFFLQSWEPVSPDQLPKTPSSSSSPFVQRAAAASARRRSTRSAVFSPSSFSSPGPSTAGVRHRLHKQPHASGRGSRDIPDISPSPSREDVAVAKKMQRREHVLQKSNTELRKQVCCGGGGGHMYLISNILSRLSINRTPLSLYAD
jgi:hypothetical protein